MKTFVENLNDFQKVKESDGKYNVIEFPKQNQDKIPKLELKNDLQTGCLHNISGFLNMTAKATTAKKKAAALETSTHRDNQIFQNVLIVNRVIKQIKKRSIKTP